MLAVRAFGVPTRQELLLFSDIAVARSRIGSSRTEAELDYLHDRGAIRYVHLPRLLKLRDADQLDPSIITEQVADSIVTECRLFGGEISKDKLQRVLLGHIGSEQRMPRDTYFAEHPANDSYYNNMTRLVASLLRHAYAEASVGVLRQDRAAAPGYIGYRTRIPHMDAPRPLPNGLRELLPPGSVQAEPILTPHKGPSDLPRTERLYDVVLSRMPMPDELTAWEDIFECRADPDTKLTFLELHRWIRKMLASDLAVSEVVEEFDYLMQQYEAHMRRHRVRSRYGKLRILLTFGADLLESALKLKLKNLVDLPFQYGERLIALDDAIRNAPGREIAYVIASRERFGA